MYRTHDLINAKDLTSTSSEDTVSIPRSPVLVNGPGLEFQNRRRGNDMSYDHEITSHYYVPSRNNATENTRIHPQQVRNNKYANTSEVIPKRVEFARHDKACQ